MPYTHYERLDASRAALLELEDANLHMHVGAVGIFDDGPLTGADGALDIDRLRAAADVASRSAPRFRQRLARIPLTGRWAWIDDERFNLHYHVRHVALPLPGDLRNLKRLAGRILSQRLDHGKPLWELWLVEGLERGFAVITKVHRAVLDRVCELELITDLMHATGDRQRAQPRWLPRPAPNRRTLFFEEIRRRASLPGALLESARRGLSEPGATLAAARERLDGLGEALTQGLSPASPTPLNRDVGPHRRVDWTRFDAAAVEDVRKRFDASVEEVILATLSGATRRFLEQEGVDVNGLDFRSALAESSGGHVDPEEGEGVVQLPIDEQDPRKRIARLKEASLVLEESRRNLGVETLTTLADWTTPRLLARFERAASRARSYNLVVRELPPPVAPTELLGSSMLEVYPLPSLSETHGMAMGFVLRGRDLFLGVNSDRGATPHLHALVEGMENELGLLRRAATGAPIRLEETAPSARPAGRKPVKEPEEPPATLAAFHERLTQLDHAFLIFEDTGAPMHVATVQTYEAGPLKTATGELDIEGMRQYTLSRLDQVPRYRQRIARTPLQGHPVWIDDDRFDIQYHLRHTRLPKPGTERQLKRLVGRIVSQQLDRGKPLWEMWAIEGLEGDRFAILNKTHHCMIDGIAGVDLLAVLLSPEPIEKIPPLPEWIPRPAPDTRELLTGEVRRWSGAPLALASNLWKLARDENHVRDDLAERLRAAGSILQTGLRYASNTPLNQPIGPHRRFDWLPMDLREIRAIKNRLGGTVNDVVITIATRAIRRFLMESRHVDVQGLDYRILAPVSTRTDEQRGTTGNRVSSWIVNLPLEEKDPVRAFERIHATTEELKKSKQALGAETLTQATEWTGTTLLSLGAQIARVGRLFNIVVTNVPGPQLPLYLLGSRMLEIHPIVPLFGNLSMGIALFSYDGTLHWGVMADRELVPDLHDFILALEESLDELRKAKP